ncbi:MAG TPA: TFIIB-type zinc ribbon-containing protein [Nitrososphaeraceae archaeon]|nr:TFIIB-type zinc ribbon-containing protein [Nitrososphaeraceae archaeon]
MMIEKEDQNSVSRCSICNQENMAITDPNSGEIICSNCGVVISDKIEDTIHPERRMFTFEGANRNARTGAPPHLWLVMIWDFLQLLEGRTKMQVVRR